MAHQTRETWLHEAMFSMTPWFEELKFLNKEEINPKKWMISCGFAKGSKKAIGQCFDPSCTEDKTTHMFVCPSIGDPIRALDILLHEMAHAVVGTKHGHKKPFIRVIRALGLEGKPTATSAEEGTELHTCLSKLSKELGKYPHSALIKKSKNKKAPGGGWVKYESKKEETYILRISPKSLEEFGPPTDPWGEEMVPSD